MRVGAVIAAAGKSGGYKSYDKMKSVDGIQVLRQMILNFKRAGVDEIVLITGYQAEQVEINWRSLVQYSFAVKIMRRKR